MTCKNKLLKLKYDENWDTSIKLKLVINKSLRRKSNPKKPENMSQLSLNT